MRGQLSEHAVERTCACGNTYKTCGNVKHCYSCRMNNRPTSTKPARGCYKQHTAVMRVTHVTFLPTCVICRSYPARKIGDEWRCARHG